MIIDVAAVLEGSSVRDMLMAEYSVDTRGLAEKQPTWKPITKKISARDVEKGVKDYILFITNEMKKYYKKHLTNLSVPVLEYGKKGRKYFRLMITDSNSGGGSSVTSSRVHSFINKETGDILKPAGMNAPAKHARGNVLDKASWKGHTHLGPPYLTRGRR